MFGADHDHNSRITTAVDHSAHKRFPDCTHPLREPDMYFVLGAPRRKSRKISNQSSAQRKGSHNLIDTLLSNLLATPTLLIELSPQEPPRSLWHCLKCERSPANTNLSPYQSVTCPMHHGNSHAAATRDSPPTISHQTRNDHSHLLPRSYRSQTAQPECLPSLASLLPGTAHSQDPVGRLIERPTEPVWFTILLW